MRDNYALVTDRIVSMLEKGVRPWNKSWSGGDTVIQHRPLRQNGMPYRGVNAVNLWAAGEISGYTSPYWFTYNGAKALGAFVRKGEHGEPCFYVGKTTKKVENKNGEEVDKAIGFLKAYTVFNADQIEGLPEKYRGKTGEAVVLAPEVRDANADAFIKNTGATIRHGGSKAYYMPSRDLIQVPAMGQFKEPAAYYATVLHELTHWTGVAKRCDRQLGVRFGDDAYAAEELVAELGAAFLCGDLSISAEPREDHASYLAHWIKVLKSDKKAIFRAAALAEKAATYLHNLQPKAETEEDEEDGEMALAA